MMNLAPDYITDAGAALGIRYGDALAAALAEISPEVGPALRDALIFEALGCVYVDVKAAEIELVGRGADAAQAQLYRLGALVAVLARLRLAGLAWSASGTPN